MIIKTHISIDSAHKLDLPYESKCNNIHGHRWEIDLILKGPLNDEGMVIDFTHLKQYFDKYDHVYLNNFFLFQTTAENMSKFWAEELKEKFKLDYIRVILAETPKNVAEYEI